jgi:hypothetical protein
MKKIGKQKVKRYLYLIYYSRKYQNIMIKLQINIICFTVIF